MKHSIRSWEYKKIEKSCVQIDIPEETIYLFQTGIRRAIKIEPRWTTWNKESYNKEEEVYALKVIYVYNSFKSMVEVDEVNVASLEDMINSSKDSYNIGSLLLDKDYNTRTKEQFEEDLNNVLNKLK